MFYAWQMLFVFWNVADVIAKRKMLSSYFLWFMADVICLFECGRCYCQEEDVILLFLWLADVIVILIVVIMLP